MGNKIRIDGGHKWAEILHHPCILGGPQRHGGQNQNWWGPQVRGNATSPLHSRGSPKTWGTKSELLGPTCARKCYITPAFSGVPKDMGDKIRIGGAHRCAEMLHHPCILGGPERHGEQNQNWWGPQVGRNATSPLHSRGFPKTWGTKSQLVGPTSGRKYYITPAFSGVPKDMGDKIRIGGAHRCAEMLHHPCILGGHERHGEQNQKWWGPQVGGNATSPLHSRGSPKTWGTKSELVGPTSGRKYYITPHSRGSPKTWGTKSELVGPTSGRKCYITLALSGISKDMGNKIRFGGAHRWAEMLHHPCILGGSQRHGGQNQIWWGPQVGGNTTSPLHSRGSPKTWGTKSELVGPTSGRKCYITPAFSGVPKDMGNKIRIGGAHKWAEMLHHPCILGGPQRHGQQNQNWWGPQVGRNATSPLHSRGFPKTWGTKSDLVGPTSGRKCYITPAFSGIPKDMGNKIRIAGGHKWAEILHHPCILGGPERHGEQNQNWWGPQVGGNATSPLHSRGSPKTWGTKSELVGPTSGRKCYITPAFSGVPKDIGNKIRMMGATSARKYYITPAFPGVPKDMGDKIRIGGAHGCAEMLHHPCILGGPQRRGGQNQNWWGQRCADMLHHPCILGGPQRHGGQNQNWWGPQVRGNATSPLHSRGSRKTWGTKSELVGPTSGRKCYITPAFSGVPKDMGDKIRIGGAHRWAEILHHPCILGGPQRHGGQNQNWWGPQVRGNATSPLHSRGSPKTWGTKSELVGPTSGRKCYIAPAFSGVPKDMGDKIRIGGAHKWAGMLHHPRILGGAERHGRQNQNWWGPQVRGNATSPLHARGFPKKWGTKSELVGPTGARKCYITPAFSGVPKDMGDKIRIGGAHKWAEMLHHPCILGGPQRHGRQNQNWWGPQVGGNTTSPLHSRGSPKTWGQNQNWWGPQVRGNATSPLHSRGSPKTWGTKSELVGPTSGRKCYITPAFSGVPKDMGDKIRIAGGHKWAEIPHHPCILGGPQRHGGQNQIWWGPQVGGNATSPLHSRGFPKTWGTKSELVGPTGARKCYITPAFSGIPKDMGNKIRIGVAHKWAEMLHHPCILGDPQTNGGQNQNWWGPQVGGNATSPLQSRGSPKTLETKSELVGPTSGRKCYITLEFSGIPKDMGNKIRIGGAHRCAEMLHHPCVLEGPERHGEQNQIWWGPQVGGNATSPLHSRGFPKTWGTKSELLGATSGRKCYITPAFSGMPKNMGNKIRIGGGHKWAEILNHPCILGDPQRHGGQNQNWWGPQVGGNATSPLHSRGSPKTWGTKSELVGPIGARKCYITPAFSGVPKDMGDKIRFGGAQKWAEMLHHPCILGGSQRHGGQNQNWWGPQVGGNATSPLHSRGSPKTWGTKSELVGPTSGRKCYITPAFSGIPKDMGDKIRIGGAHRCAEMLHHPCILGGPQRHGGQNQNWWGPLVLGNATSPLHSRGSPKTWGTKSELVWPTSGQKCYITLHSRGSEKT